VRDSRLFKALDRWLGVPAVWTWGLLRRLYATWLRNRSTTIQRILVIKLSALGDTVLLLPALAALRRNLPGTAIHLLVTEINHAAAAYAPVDRVIRFHPADIFRPARSFRFLADLRRARYDAVVDADQWLRISALLAAATGAPLLIGFKTPGQGKHSLFDHAVPHRRDRHELQCFGDLLEGFGICDDAPRLIALHTSRDDAAAGDVLKRYGVYNPFCVIHPEVPAHAHQRSWPLERFVELARSLRADTGLQVVVPLSPRGKPFAGRLRISNDDLTIIIGLPLNILSALLARARFAVCCNTGFMHIAAAAGTRVIALHGPTDATKWGPWGEGNTAIRSPEPCSPCLYLGFEYGCRDNRCMRAISVDHVRRVAACTTDLPAHTTFMTPHPETPAGFPTGSQRQK